MGPFPLHRVYGLIDAMLHLFDSTSGKKWGFLYSWVCVDGDSKLAVKPKLSSTWLGRHFAIVQGSKYK